MEEGRKFVIYQCLNCGQKIYEYYTCPNCRKKEVRFAGVLKASDFNQEIKKGLENKNL